jgi:hypothetical protein
VAVRSDIGGYIAVCDDPLEVRTAESMEAALVAVLGEGCCRTISGGDAVSRFSPSDRVYHRALKMHGTYQGRHDWGTETPETSSYVLFDGDGDWPDGRPVTTDLLMPAEEVAR